MKKLIILLIPILLFGCGLDNDAYITIKVGEATTRAATSAEDLGDVESITLYISRVGTNYVFGTGDDEIVLYGNPEGGSYEVTDGTIIEQDIDGVDVPVVDPETDELSTVWYKTVEGDTISFNIDYGLERMFTVKVTYDTGEVFIGTTQRIITSLTTDIAIEISQTTTSIAESTFNDEFEQILTDL